jgi:transcriptional regulator with XRE-family HTH domain
MSSHPRLQNYLRTYRRRAGFSQDEVAYLLGAASGTKTSRYERFRRTPSLETALACEALFGVPVRELFAGVYQKVERETRMRARRLRGKLAAAGTTPAVARKLERLGSLLGTEEEPASRLAA